MNEEDRRYEELFSKLFWGELSADESTEFNYLSEKRISKMMNNRNIKRGINR